MRNRYKLAFTLIVVIALGLASRKFPGLFPELLGKYPGDALWAAAVYLAWAMLLPNVHAIRLTGLALTTSFLVELLQLYHAPWIDAIRAEPIGHLVLGSTFNPADLVAYLAGMLLALLTDLLFLRDGHGPRVHGTGESRHARP